MENKRNENGEVIVDLSLNADKSNKRFNKIKGDQGEAVATNYLLEKGYKILETNYRNKIGEIDIIAKQNDRIIFVEVKERSTLRFGYPREAVNFKKQQKIVTIAQVYLKYKRLADSKIRFDVIEILNGQITHLENAF